MSALSSRRTSFVALVSASFLLTAVPSALGAQRDIENVAAFARLYGVARWFYPSDAAATLDWNRFAIHGVSRVRPARTTEELERALEELFTPLGPGFEIGASLAPRRPQGPRDPSLIAWRYRGAGLGQRIPGPYRAKRTNRASPLPRASGNGIVSQMRRAASLRGRVIRMRGRARVPNPNADGWAGFWLRVDRSPTERGFFDNMANRPVRDTAWREYVIEGPVADDATQIWFGALAVGDMSVDIDAIELSVRSAEGNWSPVEIDDGSFELAPATGQPWGLMGPHTYARPRSGAADGAQFLRITAPAAGVSPIEPPSDSLETPNAGDVAEIDLGGGLRARVPLALTDADARVPSPEPPSLTAVRAASSALERAASRDDVDARLADVVVAWNVFAHFYPYWDDVAVDWRTRLTSHLVAAREARSRDDHLEALRALVADVQDGHGWVQDGAGAPGGWALLPVLFRVLGDQVVVTASRDSAVPVGSVIIAIAGGSISQRLAKELRLASGTLQWRQSRAAVELMKCRAGTMVEMTVELPGGTRRAARLGCEHSSVLLAEKRPAPLSELEPGIWYVDLTRLRGTELSRALERLALARGVVFDVRGYPTDIGRLILPHLMTFPEDSTSDRWMHVSRITGPFGRSGGWTSFSWNLKPSAPPIAARRVFLADGRAISYAESVMGYVRDHKLGTIIGGTTAGANGNVASFATPGGFSVVFTGMRVTRHDGRTPFHMAGVAPDIAVEPTLAGIRAGRDEVLERALALLR